MPLRGLERDNVANEIPLDSNTSGDRHYVSFEFYPFHEGMTFAVYKGLLSTEARRGKTFCVVKALLDQESNTDQLNDAVKRAMEAQRLAAKFNSIMGYEAVTFQIPCLAEVQRISDFIGLFRCVVPHEKRLTRQETVIIEEFIDGDFSLFNTSNGTVPAINTSMAHTARQRKSIVLPKKLKPKKKLKKSPSTTSSSPSSSSADAIHELPKPKRNPLPSTIGPNNLAQAFSHFTWHETNTLVVCDLKGVISNNSYCFSNPTIHSLDLSYGSRDRGPSAISEVFVSHRCTNVCREWGQFTTRGSNNAKNQVNFYEQFNEHQQQRERLDKPITATNQKNKNICTHDNKLS